MTCIGDSVSPALPHTGLKLCLKVDNDKEIESDGDYVTKSKKYVKRK